jgi:hypothetical protein
MAPADKKAADPSQRTNARTVTVEVNGQQDDMLRKFAASHPELGSIEDILRQGFAEFAKSKRISRQ